MSFDEIAKVAKHLFKSYFSVRLTLFSFNEIIINFTHKTLTNWFTFSLHYSQNCFNYISLIFETIIFTMIKLKLPIYPRNAFTFCIEPKSLLIH